MKKNLVPILFTFTSLSAFALLGFNWSDSDLSISDAPSYDYGHVVIGDTAEHTFTISNVSDELVQISRIQPLDAPFAVTGGTCAPMQLLHPQESCTAIVTFSPSATQVYNAQLAVDFAERRGGDFGTTRPITGTGVETGPTPTTIPTTTTTMPTTPTTIPTTTTLPTPTTTTLPTGAICNMGDTSVAYNAIPQGGANCPGTSQAFQAAGVNEFGGGVTLAGSSRKLSQLKVVLVSTACQSGTQAGGNCVSAANATFSHPVTANIYAVSSCNGAPCPGALLATVTQTVAVPYRPSADASTCTGASAGGWFNHAAADGGHCQQDIGYVATFNFASQNITLPQQVIWTVAFNTSAYGAAPIGIDAACYSTAQGCGYDFLAVGAQSQAGAPYAGADLNADTAFISKGHPVGALDAASGYTAMKPEGAIVTQE